MKKPKNATLHRDVSGVSFFSIGDRQYYKFRVGEGNYDWVLMSHLISCNAGRSGDDNYYEERIGW